MIDYYLDGQPQSIDDWFDMLDAAFDPGGCSCVSSYEKDVFQTAFTSISRVITVHSDFDYEIQIQSPVDKAQIIMAVSNKRIDPQKALGAIRQYNIEDRWIYKLFLFRCSDAFCFPGVMCLAQTSFDGATLSLVFAHNHDDVYTLDFQRYSLIINSSLQSTQIFRVTNAVCTNIAGSYLPTSQLMTGSGSYVRDQLGFYNGVSNQNPGHLYLLQDLKTGIKSRAVLLYGCFKLLDI